VTPAAFLADLRRRGFTLAADGEQLRVRGPRGRLDADVKAALRAQRHGVLELLRLETAWATLTPAECERFEAEVAAGDPLARTIRTLLTESGSTA
jgi:hypothetical protein